MATFKFNLRNGIVFVGYEHNQELFELSSGVQVLEENWDGRMVKETDHNHKRKNALLNEYFMELSSLVEKMNKNHIPITIENVRKQWKQSAEESSVVQFPFFKDIEEWLKRKSGEFTVEEDETFKEVFALAKEFELLGYKWDIDLLDKNFYNSYLYFLVMFKDFSQSSLVEHFNYFSRCLKEVYPGQDLGFFQYKRLKLPKIYWLNYGEISAIESAVNLPGSWEKTREIFLFTVCTGLTFAETQPNERGWLEPDFVTEYEMLLKNDIADTPLKGLASAILKRNNGELPSMSYDQYVAELKSLMKALKINGKVQDPENESEFVPLYEVIDGNLGRDTFIMLSLIGNTPANIIGSLVGCYDFRAMFPYLFAVRDNKPPEESFMTWKF